MKVNGTILYRCDPDKNVKCAANHCYRNGGPCKHDIHKENKINIFKRIKEWFVYGRKGN